jgi:dTDP-6-deoxy-L-talose 4-dehydrogenase (NAD+)
MRYGPLRETQDARPNTPYAFAKDALRRRLEFLRATHAFAMTWGRLFYLTGEGQGPHALASQLRAAVERGEREFPMSGGEQLRDYLPVETAADHIVRLALSGVDHGVVNICSGRPISVRRLVEQLIEAHGLPIRPRLGALEYPRHESMAFWGDRDKLERCLSQA